MSRKGDIHFAIDQISPQRVKGWAFNERHPDRPLRIVVNYDGRTITVVASIMRADLRTAFGHSGAHGFDVALAPPAGVNAVEIGVVLDNGEHLSLASGRAESLIEGWREAERYIEKNQHVGALGFEPAEQDGLLKRVRAEFRDWSADVEEMARRWDVVLVNRCGERDGHLAEVDALVGAGVMTVFAAVSHVDLPDSLGGSVALRSDANGQPQRVHLLRDIQAHLRMRYAVRYIFDMGTGADGLRRSLLRIDRRQCQVVFVGGATRAGKSSIASAICPADGQIISVDAVVIELRNVAGLSDGLSPKLRQLIREPAFILPAFYDSIMGSALLDELAKAVALYVAPEMFSLAVIEGVPVNDRFAKAVKRELGERCRYWQMGAV